MDYNVVFLLGWSYLLYNKQYQYLTTYLIAYFCYAYYDNPIVSMIIIPTILLFMVTSLIIVYIYTKPDNSKRKSKNKNKKCIKNNKKNI